MAGSRVTPWPGCGRKDPSALGSYYAACGPLAASAPASPCACDVFGEVTVRALVHPVGRSAGHGGREDAQAALGRQLGVEGEVHRKVAPALGCVRIDDRLKTLVGGCDCLLGHL